MSDKKTRTLRIILITIIFISSALLVGMFVRDHALSKSEKQMKEAAKPVEEAEKEPENSPIDFKALKEQNTDIYAWIRIPNTLVDYAITQSTPDKGEDFYLTHGYSKEKLEIGTIYTQMVNSKDFSDSVTVIYGHNCPSSGKMFRTIHKYEDTQFFTNNPTFTIYTSDNRKFEYRVFAAFNYDNRLIMDYFGQFKTDKARDSFLSDVKSRAKEKFNYDEAGEPAKDDKLVVLSTCNGDEDERFIVVSKLISEEKLNPYVEAEDEDL